MVGEVFAAHVYAQAVPFSGNAKRLAKINPKNYFDTRNDVGKLHADDESGVKFGSKGKAAK